MYDNNHTIIAWRSSIIIIHIMMWFLHQGEPCCSDRAAVHGVQVLRKLFWDFLSMLINQLVFQIFCTAMFSQCINCRNLAAKNHESQTALHLASYHGHVEVVQQLLKYGAKVVQTQTQNQIHKNTMVASWPHLVNASTFYSKGVVHW